MKKAKIYLLSLASLVLLAMSAVIMSVIIKACRIGNKCCRTADADRPDE